MFVVNAVGTNLLIFWYKYNMKMKINYQAVVLVKELVYFWCFKCDVYYKFIPQYLISSSGEGTKSLSVIKYYNELIIEHSMNSYKIGIVFDVYQIIRSKEASWYGTHQIWK